MSRKHPNIAMRQCVNASQATAAALRAAEAGETERHRHRIFFPRPLFDDLFAFRLDDTARRTSCDKSRAFRYTSSSSDRGRCSATPWGGQHAITWHHMLKVESPLRPQHCRERPGVCIRGFLQIVGRLGSQGRWSEKMAVELCQPKTSRSLEIACSGFLERCRSGGLAFHRHLVDCLAHLCAVTAATQTRPLL